MAHAQKPDFVFRRNGRVHINRWGRQFSRLLEAEVCASAVVMLDTPCSEVVWMVLATHSIRQFPLHFTSRASPCAITFQLDSTIFVTGHFLQRRIVTFKLAMAVYCLLLSDYSADRLQVFVLTYMSHFRRVYNTGLRPAAHIMRTEATFVNYVYTINI